MPDANTYTVGWICAIQPEYVAAQSFLDEKHDRPDHVAPNDNSIYTLGRVGKHNIVIGVLPDGEYGTTSAASLANGMCISFSKIRIVLMVGIGGGAPSVRHDIRLGDIVVSAPRDGHGGVFQYDFGKTIQNQAFQTTGFLNQSPELLRAAIADIQTEYEMDGHQLEEGVNKIFDKRPRLRQKYQRPGEDSDRLFQSWVVHPASEGATCAADCYKDPPSLVERRKRTNEEDNPTIHYGTIASANQLMRDAHIRDKLATEHNILCFEMEAAGLMNRFPCIVIRGICDYADSHKNKDWQGYAAMVAAAYAKDLLRRIPPNKVEAERQISTILNSVSERVEAVQTAVKTAADKVDDVLTTLRFDRLAIAADASFDSSAEQHNSTCLPNTRVELLRQIKEWAMDPGSKSIFWIDGMAGTGKSTISRTVARTFSELGYLGASFFFKRGEADRGSLSKFFTTIATDLVKREPATAPHVKAAIDADPHIAGKAAIYQFDKLIKQPLRCTVAAWKSAPLAIVIDALDECDEDKDIRLLIDLFFSTGDMLLPKLRILITSRPEPPIRLGFRKFKGLYQHFVLNEIPKLVVKQDIILYLQSELGSIRDDHDIHENWPSQDDILALADMASPLFIAAATICRFIDEDRLDPRERLLEVLDYQSKEAYSNIDTIYSLILNRSVEGLRQCDKDKVLRNFQKIVGSILVLLDPLSASALEQILQENIETISRTLKFLHSVLSVPSSHDIPIRLLHLSFRDFILSPERGAILFHVDQREAHETMAAHCLQVLSSFLHMNLCNVSWPGTDRSSIEQNDIDSVITAAQRYACRYWAYHTRKAELCVGDDGPVFRFLQQHFLHWVEALSLLGRASESLSIIIDLRSILPTTGCSHLADFLQDGQRFIRNNIATINSVPLQIYSSILAFTPKNSIIRNMFFQEDQVPNWISLPPEPEEDWDQCEQILDGHNDSVRAVAFSPDGTVVASVSDDRTLRLWRVADGSYTEFKDYSGRPNAVAFSPDGTVVASASSDNSVRLWRFADGSFTELEGHSNLVRAITFSPDGTVVASVSEDRTARLWRIADGSCMELKGHSDWVLAVAFSPDGTIVASGSGDKTVRLWRVIDGFCTQELKGHSGWVRTVSFSPDGSIVASATDRTVWLWRIADGSFTELKGYGDLVTAMFFSPNGIVIASGSDDEMVRLRRVNDGSYTELKGHSDWVNAITFSPDGTIMASASKDKTVRLWRITDSSYTKFEACRGWVRDVIFSPDGTIIASATNNRTIQLWRAADGSYKELEGHSDFVNTINFSPDGAIMASASKDKTVRLWRAADGSCIQEIKGHNDSVQAVAFSPDGTVVVAASKDKIVRLWRIADGSCTHELKAHGAFVSAIAFSSDSTIMALAYHQKTVQLWRPLTGSCIQELKGHCAMVSAVAFSPDGTIVASASKDKTVRLWRVIDGFCTQELKGHSGWVRAVAFSPDGTIVASASDDGTVRLWRASNGSCLQEVTGILSTQLQFDPTGLNIRTNAGVISIDSSISPPETIITPFSDSLAGLGISRDGCWIMWQGNRLFWLPQSFRPDTCSTVSGLTIAIGSNLGRVIIISFNPIISQW